MKYRIKGRGVKESKTIENVVQHYLCHSCGACAVVCPTQAISYEETIGGYFFPRVLSDRCTECGLCLRVCPGNKLGSTLTKSMPLDPFVGIAQKCFIGKATDKNIYQNAQSGGVVTALLCHALKERTIGAALVTTMEQAVPPRPSAHIVTTLTDVIRAQKSKYAPVAALTPLREIDSVEGPIAVVGLPCHIHGLWHIMDLNPKLRDRIALIIGLICDRTLTLAAIDYLARQTSLPGEPSMLIFRDKAAGGYPGNIHVYDKRGTDVVIPNAVRLRIKDYFTPARCWICFDKLNIFADVTIGDPWGIPEADQKYGESVIITRTPAGVNAVESACAAGALLLRRVPYERIVEGQKIEVKRRKWKSYVTAWKALGLDIPEYPERIYEVSIETDSPKHYFLQQLSWSLALDKHQNRETLLRSVNKLVKKQSWQIRRIWRAPRRFIKLGKRVLRKGLIFLLPPPQSAEREKENRLTIEIKGVGFENKGAELMLHAILDRVGRVFGNAKFTMVPYPKVSPYEKIVALGIYPKIWFRRYKIQWGYVANKFPRRILKMYGLVTDSDINVVLDASGFAYGDQWGLGNTIAMAKAMRRWKKQGTKVIFLPQSFGPFTEQKVRKAFCDMATLADRMYARDAISYQHIVEVVGELQQIRQAPDFTVLLKGKIPLSFDSISHNIAIIPNKRMIDKTSPSVARFYPSFCVTCIRKFLDAGLKPFFLIHGGDEDVELARQILHSMGSMGNEIPILKEDNPIIIKGIIGACKGVVSSRYHGLISALSQQVPVIATGWSHKYQTLMEEYSCPEYLVIEGSPNEEMEWIINTFIKNLNTLKERLIEPALRHRQAAEAMWDDVIRVIMVGVN